MGIQILINSLMVSVGATLFAIIPGLAAAWLLQIASPVTRRILMASMVAVLALPGFFVAGMWMDWVGFAGAWRIGSGWVAENLLAYLCTTFVLGLLLWPITALLVSQSWQGMDRRLLEAHLELRGGSLLRHLLWPAASQTLPEPALLTALLAFANFGVPALFQARVWPAEVWLEFSTRFDAAAALAKSALPAILTWITLAWIIRRNFVWRAGIDRNSAGLLRDRAGRFVNGVAVAATIAALLLSLGFPLFTALIDRRTWVELMPAARAAWPVALRSALCAGSAATLACLIGMATARHRGMAIALTTFALPGIFVGIGLTFLTNANLWLMPLFRDSVLIVITALLTRYLGIGWIGASHAWKSANSTLHECARLDGANLLQQWRHVVWPQGRGGILGTWLAVYLLCLWDVETLILIVPPGGDSLALMIFNLLHYGHNAQVTALCLMLGAVAVLPLGLYSIWRHGFGRHTAFAAGVALSLALLQTGCSPPENQTGIALRSPLFERVEVIGARGTGPGFFNKPRSVAVDEADNLFVVDMTGRVQKFDKEGRWLMLWQMPETDKGKAKGMARAPGGGILVIEPHYNRVNHFSDQGQLLRQWGVLGTNAGALWFPRAIAVNQNSECYVSEYGVVERVQRFALESGAYLGSFGSAGTGPGEFNRVEGLGCDRAGNVYVADACNHRIQVFTGDGRLLRSHGAPGRGMGEFSYPYDVQIDDAGRQYVCEFGNSRIQILDRDDKPEEVLGGPGALPGQMHNPWSLCLDSQGNLYVADSGNHRVLKFVRRERPRAGIDTLRPALRLDIAVGRS